MRPTRTILIAAAAAYLAACGVSALTVQARTATAAKPVLVQAHEEILGARERAQRSAVDAATSAAEATEAAQAARARFDPLLGAYSLVRVAYTEWVEEMVRGIDGDFDAERAAGLAMRVLARYEELRTAAGQMGLELRPMNMGDL